MAGPATGKALRSMRQLLRPTSHAKIVVAVVAVVGIRVSFVAIIASLVVLYGVEGVDSAV